MGQQSTLHKVNQKRSTTLPQDMGRAEENNTSLPPASFQHRCCKLVHLGVRKRRRRWSGKIRHDRSRSCTTLLQGQQPQLAYVKLGKGHLGRDYGHRDRQSASSVRPQVVRRIKPRVWALAAGYSLARFSFSPAEVGLPAWPASGVSATRACTSSLLAGLSTSNTALASFCCSSALVQPAAWLRLPLLGL